MLWGYNLCLPHATVSRQYIALWVESPQDNLEVERGTHIIKSPRITLRSINTNPRTPTNKEIPLITRGMPMDLPQRPRFHRDHRSTELTRDREDRWIDHFDRSAGCFVVIGFLG